MALRRCSVGRHTVQSGCGSLQASDGSEEHEHQRVREPQAPRERTATAQGLVPLRVGRRVFGATRGATQDRTAARGRRGRLIIRGIPLRSKQGRIRFSQGRPFKGRKGGFITRPFVGTSSWGNINPW